MKFEDALKICVDVQPNYRKPKWISVKSKIPKVGSNIFATNGRFNFISVFDGNDLKSSDFTHWMYVNTQLENYLLKLSSEL